MPVDLSALKNLSNNAFTWSFEDLGRKLGYDPPPHPNRKSDDGYGHVIRVWDGLVALSSAVRNLDDQTLQVLCAPREAAS